MTIDEMRIWTFRQTMRKSIRVSNDVSTTLENVIVALKTDSGTAGFGEASPIPQFGGETPETVIDAIRRHLGRCVIGADPFDVEEVIHMMSKALDGNPCAKSAIEMAMYDLMGKETAKPLYKLIGGQYRDSVREGGGSGIVPVDETIDYVKGLYLDRGVRKIKLKIGLSAARDIECARRIRDEFGSDITLRVDANQGWGSPANAIKIIKKMERYDVDFVEQPLPAWNLDGIAEIRKATNTKIMLDESVYTPRDAVRAIEKRACDIINIKLAKSGGIRNALAINHIAEANDIPCYVGSMLETGLGLGVGLQIAAAQRNIEDGDFRLLTIFALDEDTVDPFEEIAANDGLHIKIPSGDGLGVRVKEEIIKKYAASAETLTRSTL